MNNISQATSWFLQGKTLELKNNSFAKSSFCNRFYRSALRQHNQPIQAIATFIQDKLAQANGPEQKKEYLALADAFVMRHASKWNGGKITRVFDRTIVRYKPDVQFTHRSNQTSYQKWLRNHQPAHIYHQYPEFCTFLETSRLLSQIKITRDSTGEIEGEAAILVEGTWMKWDSLKDLFEIKTSERYREKFIVHKQTRDIYTYLDNGKGLQKHHPYLTENTPISILNDNEYQKVLAKAHAFIRPEEKHLNDCERQALNADRPFVVQIVTSRVAGRNSRLHDLILKPKHPYLRIIAKVNHSKNHAASVSEIGYNGPRRKFVASFMTNQGQFRSPDLWEYGHCEERIVTNIALSQEEAKKLQEYTVKYHRDGVNLGNPLAFHFTRHNCTTYAHHALATVNIAVPTEISLASLIHEISPEWMAKIADFFAQFRKKTKKTLKHMVSLLPSPIHHALTSIANKISRCTHRIAKATTAFAIAPLFAVFGGLSGKGGQAFVLPNTPPRHIHPPLSNWKNWLRLSTYRVYLPGILQRWQKEQASTVVYRKPLRLTIVP